MRKAVRGEGASWSKNTIKERKGLRRLHGRWDTASGFARLGPDHLVLGIARRTYPGEESACSLLVSAELGITRPARATTLRDNLRGRSSEVKDCATLNPFHGRPCQHDSEGGDFPSGVECTPWGDDRRPVLPWLRPTPQ